MALGVFGLSESRVGCRGGGGGGGGNEGGGGGGGNEGALETSAKLSTLAGEFETRSEDTSDGVGDEL